MGASPEKARTLAKGEARAVEGGADPIAARKEARAVRTFREVAEEFLDVHVKGKRGARTAEEYRRLLGKHIFPAIGWIQVVDLRRADVVRLHTKEVIEMPVNANRALAVISSVSSWAARRDEVFYGNRKSGAGS